MTPGQLKNKRMIHRMTAGLTIDASSPKGQEMLHRIGMLVVAQTKLNIRQQGLIDQGGLLNSIRYEITSEGLEVGSYGVPYAATHEYGTVGKGGVLPDIRPVNAKNLTIPLETAYKRVTARQIFHNLTYVRSNGRAFLYDTTVNRFAYLLLKKVSIPPKPYLRPAIRDQVPEILKIIREYI